MDKREFMKRWMEENSDPYKGWDVVYDVIVNDANGMTTAINGRPNPANTAIVDWGDGSEQSYWNYDVTNAHTYAVEGTYTVKIKNLASLNFINSMRLWAVVDGVYTRQTVGTIRKLKNLTSNISYSPDISNCANADILDGVLDDRITSIGGFVGCSSLSLSRLPASVITIKSLGFRFCSSLRISEIPASVTTIGNYAFQECWTAARPWIIAFNGTPSEIQSCFVGCTGITDIYVPWSEGEVANAPWGATNATIHYNHIA